MANSNIQMSEALTTAIFLTLSGGFQDAYTYCCRQGVFANAQTGNIVLMSTYAFRGEWYSVVRYLIPVIAFMGGIFIAEIIHKKFKYMNKIHWRQLIIIFEIVLLFAVGFLPHNLDIVSNVIVSFVCAMQVQTFRKIGSHLYASTMCIGNIRSATESLCIYFHEKDINFLNKALKYFCVIISFAIGAGIGSIFTGIFGIKSIWISCVMLSISFLLMFIKK